jgi:hypothetical protein
LTQTILCHASAPEDNHRLLVEGLPMERLDRYLAFRHRFRNLYLFDLDLSLLMRQ